MEAKKLNVEMRQGDGKGPAGRLRSSGKIPAVIYGHTTPTSITWTPGSSATHSGG